MEKFKTLVINRKNRWIVSGDTVPTQLAAATNKEQAVNLVKEITENYPSVELWADVSDTIWNEIQHLPVKRVRRYSPEGREIRDNMLQVLDQVGYIPTNQGWMYPEEIQENDGIF
jgi:hypothetical protein